MLVTAEHEGTVELGACAEPVVAAACACAPGPPRAARWLLSAAPACAPLEGGALLVTAELEVTVELVASVELEVTVESACALGPLSVARWVW